MGHLRGTRGTRGILSGYLGVLSGHEGYSRGTSGLRHLAYVGMTLGALEALVGDAFECALLYAG